MRKSKQSRRARIRARRNILRSSKRQFDHRKVDPRNTIPWLGAVKTPDKQTRVHMDRDNETGIGNRNREHMDQDNETKIRDQDRLHIDRAESTNNLKKVQTT